MTRGQALAILGLRENVAVLEDVKPAYRKMALLTHPDKPGGSREKFQPVLDAYEFLTGRGKVTRMRPQPVRVQVHWVQVGGYSYTGTTSAGTTGGTWF